jgi:hypothetical protein
LAAAAPDDPASSSSLAAAGFRPLPPLLLFELPPFPSRLFLVLLLPRLELPDDPPLDRFVACGSVGADAPRPQTAGPSLGSSGSFGRSPGRSPGAGGGTALSFMEASSNITGGGGGGGGFSAESLLSSPSRSYTGGGAASAPKASRALKLSMSRSTTSGGGGAGGGPLFPEDEDSHEGVMLRIKNLGEKNKFLQRELSAKDKQIINLKLQVRRLQASAKEEKDKIGAVLAGYKAFKQIAAEAEADVVEVDEDEAADARPGERLDSPRADAADADDHDRSSGDPVGCGVARSDTLQRKLIDANVT